MITAPLKEVSKLRPPFRNHEPTTKVPNIGPVLRDRLLDWKNTLVSKFVLKQALPESERNRIATRYAPVFLPLIQSVEAAIRDIESFAASERDRDRERVKAIGAVVQTVANVSADLVALNRLVSGFPERLQYPVVGAQRL